MLEQPQNDAPIPLRPLPDIAAALRQRLERIVRRWSEEVEQLLPHADPLTRTQVRDSIPKVLEKIAMALESAEQQTIGVLHEVATAHGVARFQEGYNIEEVVIEYRLLRRIVFEELYAAVGFKITFADAIVIDAGVDIALQRGVVTYVRHLTSQLKSAADAESKFLAFLSHDLRNNLNSATLMLELLYRRLSDDPQFAQDAQDVRALQSSILQTVTGMDRLLQAERLRRQTVKLNFGPVDLHQLAEDLLTRVAHDAETKGLRLVNAVPNNVAIHSDRELLALALQNLLGNAVKYSASGVIQIEARQDSKGWRLAVSDQGPGIAPERLKTLFEAFSRGDSHGQAGMGLGLSIASHAARRLGSELSVESTLGQGSTFSFILPPA